MPIEEYNYNDVESGRGETLVKALDKIELLEKQLDIAIEILEFYADTGNWYTNQNGESCEFAGWDGYEDAQEALQQIKELKDEYEKDKSI